MTTRETTSGWRLRSSDSEHADSNSSSLQDASKGREAYKRIRTLATSFAKSLESHLSPGLSNQYITTADICSYSDEQQRVTEAARRIFGTLRALSENNLELGSRSYYVGNLIDSEARIDSTATLEASAAILRARAAVVPEASKAALLRALAGRHQFESRAEFTNMCISSLYSSDEMQAVAAARTLGETGDVAALPQIRHALKFAHGERVRSIISSVIKEIERHNAADESSAERA